MTNVPFDLIVKQFYELDPRIRIIAVHPGFLQHRLFLSTLFTEVQRPVYVRFEGEKLSRAEIDQQLREAAARQHLDLTNAELIVLDECDRVQEEAVGEFLAALCDSLDGVRVVVIGRFPLTVIAQHDKLREQAQFIPESENLLLVNYVTLNQQDKMLLEVHSFGSGHVFLNGKPITAWDGLLPRDLFFYLVDKGMTTRNDIFETFWPNLDVRDATNVFHVTKRKISEVLGVDLTNYWSGFYHISEKLNLSYDVARFTDLLQKSAVRDKAESAELLRCAIWLYRDNFLSRLDMKWAKTRRHELRQSYGEALVSLARLMEGDQNLTEALGLYLRAATTNRHREDIAFQVMKLYNDMDKPGDALAVYGVLKTALEHELNVSPAPHLQEFAEVLTLRTR